MLSVRSLLSKQKKKIDSSNFLLMVTVGLFALMYIIGLVVYVRKSTKKEPVQVNDLTDEQREELRKQLLAELSGGAKKEEKPAENAENDKE